MSFSVAGQDVVVVGGARSGVAAAELLHERGARVTLTDSRTDPFEGADRLEKLGVTVELGPHRESLLLDADLVVLSPGVPPEQPVLQAARRKGVPVIGEVELASRWLTGKVVAISGIASGQGRAAAILFAHHGARVVGCDLDEDGARTTGAAAHDAVRAASSGGSVVAVRADVSDESEVERWITTAVEERASAKPMTSAATGGIRSAIAMAPSTAAEPKTCSAPSPNTRRRMRASRSQDSSSPIMNSRNTTPNSATGAMEATSSSAKALSGSNRRASAPNP